MTHWESSSPQVHYHQHGGEYTVPYIPIRVELASVRYISVSVRSVRSIRTQKVPLVVRGGVQRAILTGGPSILNRNRNLPSIGRHIHLFVSSPLSFSFTFFLSPAYPQGRWLERGRLFFLFSFFLAGRHDHAGYPVWQASRGEEK